MMEYEDVLKEEITGFAGRLGSDMKRRQGLRWPQEYLTKQ